MDPMIPFLTGWLFAIALDRGGECMKIVCCNYLDPASGLRLRVRVDSCSEMTAVMDRARSKE